MRPKVCLLAVHRKLHDIVATKLILDWSPEQISGRLKSQYPNDASLRVSHETIYRSLFLQARGLLKQEAGEASTVAAAESLGREKKGKPT